MVPAASLIYLEGRYYRNSGAKAPDYTALGIKLVCFEHRIQPSQIWKNERCGLRLKHFESRRRLCGFGCTIWEWECLQITAGRSGNYMYPSIRWQGFTSIGKTDMPKRERKLDLYDIISCIGDKKLDL